MDLPVPVARLVTRGVIAPLLAPRLPLPVRRRLLDAVGYTVPLPRGTRRSHGALGGVPTERVVARGALGPHQVLYLHGGGYQTGSPAAYRALVAHLSLSSGAPVHVPRYRLAPEHPYPAAVEDALAAFRALREAGHPARRIAVAGDSAGGGLTMALLLRLRAVGEELPGSVGLISPWLDLDLRTASLATNASTDAMLKPAWLPQAAADYLGSGNGSGDGSGELRPLEADLAGFPPLHVVAGAAEILVDDADRLVERASAADVPTTYTRVPDMWHDHLTFAGMFGPATRDTTALGAALRTDLS